MPHRAKLVVSVNRLLSGDDHRSMERARRILEEAGDLVEAAEQAGLFDEEGGDAAREAVEALSPSVAAAILAAMTSAAERELPLVFQWKPGATTEVQVWEAVDDGVGQVGMLLVTPYGRDMGSASY